MPISNCIDNLFVVFEDERSLYFFHFLMHQLEIVVVKMDLAAEAHYGAIICK
jgi:hypothetical protein